MNPKGPLTPKSSTLADASGNRDVGRINFRYFLRQQGTRKDASGVEARLLLDLSGSTTAGMERAIVRRFAKDAEQCRHYLNMLAGQVDAFQNRKPRPIVIDPQDWLRLESGGHMRKRHFGSGM